MKPGEEMHSAVEEVDVDPCDLYLDLGALIVEGRTPGLTDRGFGEGPHCPPAAPSVGATQSRHQCDPQKVECQRHEQMQKHMLLLWKNSIPMSIEVLLYPKCCVGSAPFQNVDTSSVPDMNYILMEQWTVHMLPRRVLDASINPRGLMQAIRSFLYFSQLCAWYSLTGGKSPQNIHFRVCVPGEAFSSRFASPPDCHIFPIANIGRNAAMKVLVKSRPRCGEIPRVPCHKHSASLLSKKAIKHDPKGASALKQLEEPGTEDEFIDGILIPEIQLSPRTSSPADTMLGESLLDPPNSLCMYPKRYQSPSRCGSPSLEVPEHLMFGKAASVSHEAQRQRLNPDPHNRSRPLQRPVFQRVLEKKLSDGLLSSISSSSSSPSSSSSTSSKHMENCHVSKSMLQSHHMDNAHVNRDLASYLCISGDLKEVPKAEMESVLHKLRNSQCSRTSQDRSHYPYLVNHSEKFHLLNKELEIDKDREKTTAAPSKIPFHHDKSIHPIFAYRPSFHQIQKSLLTYKPETLTKQAKRTNKDQHSKAHFQKSSEISKLNYDNGKQSNISIDDMMEQKMGSFSCKSKTNKYFQSDNDIQSDGDFGLHGLPAFSGVNIKKCGALLQSLTLNEKLIDERGIDNSTHWRGKSKSPDALSEDVDYCYHIVPSAEEKAQFRKSLDSATSLVFHQKNGLPLTSSPAPIRKSGTCFDFDSSLTSVSAIKRALFEKEPETEECEKLRLHPCSLSAPSSMTVSSLLGTFEESVLNGRLEPVSTVEGFTAEIGASGSFCPRHITLPVTIFFYTLQDIDKVTSPYLGHINLGKKDYHIPKQGTVQVTLFNPHRTVVKMFVVRYDLCDMPPNCQTFLRQRTLYMPSDASEDDQEAQKWLRYLIHLRFASSKSGRIYLHTDIRMIIFRKSDLDAATVHGQRPYELRSFIQGPLNPKFSPRKL